jgi:hypothetical protein
MIDMINGNRRSSNGVDRAVAGGATGVESK